MTPGELRWELTGAPLATPRAAHPLAAVLSDPNRDRRELLDLMTCRLRSSHPFGLAEDVPTPTARRPMIDHLIDRPRWQQRPPMTLMPGLATGLTPRRILAPLGRSSRRI
jgi:hypothetical protein